jgi:hypothetical protein
MIPRLASLAALLGLVFDIASCRAEGPVPNWLHEGARTHVDGQSDDLVTAGLGAEAMLNSAPAYADPVHPTAVELRRAAIFFKGSAGRVLGGCTGPMSTKQPVNSIRTAEKLPETRSWHLMMTARAGKMSACCFRFR